MVRKTKEEAQLTYTALLDSAERTFCEKGVARTTLNDIAADAGLTRGAIYWHFKDKNALFEAMCNRAFLPMESLFNEIQATTERDPLAALRQMTIQMLSQVSIDTHKKNVFDIIFHHCEKNDETATFMHERNKRAECLKMFDVILCEAVKQGKLPAQTDTFLAVQALNSYMIGLIYEWLLDPQSYSLAKHAETMTDLFFAGLIARPPLKKARLAHS